MGQPSFSLQPVEWQGFPQHLRICCCVLCLQKNQFLCLKQKVVHKCSFFSSKATAISPQGKSREFSVFHLSYFSIDWSVVCIFFQFLYSLSFRLGISLPKIPRVTLQISFSFTQRPLNTQRTSIVIPSTFNSVWVCSPNHRLNTAILLLYTI